MKGFNFYQDAAKEWRWNLKDGDNNIVADSAEGYKHKADCEKGAALFTTLGPDAPVRKIVEPDTSGNGPEWEYYEDKASKWRWRFQAKNNKILADSSKGYDNESIVQSVIKDVKALLSDIGSKSNSGSTGAYIPPVSGGKESGGRFA